MAEYLYRFRASMPAYALTAYIAGSYDSHEIAEYYTFRRMLSLATVDVAHAEPGTALTVPLGNAGRTAEADPRHRLSCPLQPGSQPRRPPPRLTAAGESIPSTWPRQSGRGTRRAPPRGT